MTRGKFHEIADMVRVKRLSQGARTPDGDRKNIVRESGLTTQAVEEIKAK